MAKKKLSEVRSKPLVYEFKVSLIGTKPLVWRKFLAHDLITLEELHSLIQMSMGWEMAHLYKFKFGKSKYGPSILEEDGLISGTEDIALKDVLKDQKQFSYTYDFGDNWEHKVEITDVMDHDPRRMYPVCTGGENACPPEDCGGVIGYKELKEALSKKNSSEKDEALEWLGGYFNPTTFDPNFVNKYLLWAEYE